MLKVNSLLNELPVNREAESIVGSDTWRRREWQRCSQSRLYFLKHYGTIRHPIKGTIKFEAWPHLVYLLQVLAKYRLIILLKRKQIGITWLNAGDNLWLTTFQDGANVMTLSKGEAEAAESLDYSRFIHGNLPTFLALPPGKNQESTISFPAMNSKIKALPATKDSGVGFGGATKAVFDEFEYHDYAYENYSEVKAMIDTSLGQLFILTTVDKLRQRTKFKELYRGARAGDNNFFPIFLGYREVPDPDPKFYENLKRDLADWEIESKYPRTEQEALAPSSAVCRFEVSALKDMLADCATIKPIEERRNGIVKIYKHSVANRKYIFPIDTSEGEYDPACGGVIDWQTCERVAGFHGKIPIDEQARIIFELYEEYNKPYCAPERNAGGILLIEKLKDMGVRNFHYTAKDKPGWWTSSRTRPVMIEGLAEAVRLRDIREPEPKAIDEFLSFIRSEKHPDGKATGGMHDDFVMMWAIGMEIRKHVRGTQLTSTVKSHQYQITR
uniref:Putative terminase n=1 Tax=viral metagenome TaxID=1070528 RepID=A0A6M3XXA6_9ZZZZ